MNGLPSGIPTLAAFGSPLRAEMLARLESQSAVFLQRNRDELSAYMRQWVRDPLQQWSRLWEYPFVYSHVVDCAEEFGDQPFNVLDAGSGITFFSYMLAGQWKAASIHCVDRDAKLAAMYDQINKRETRPVDFHVSGIDALPFQDESMDLIYCISVLEHTGNHEAILQEFARVLKKNGRLIITFDVGLDGVSDVNPGAMLKLNAALEKRFEDRPGRALPASDRETMFANCLTTRYFRRRQPEALPWTHPRLSLLKAALKSKRVPKTLVKELAVDCRALRKRD